MQRLIAQHEAAIEQDGTFAFAHETIILALQQMQRGWVYAGQATSVLAGTVARVSDEPEKVARSRIVLAVLRQIKDQWG